MELQQDGFPKMFDDTGKKESQYFVTSFPTLPSGKLPHNYSMYGQYSFLMGKSTINHHFQSLFVCLPGRVHPKNEIFLPPKIHTPGFSSQFQLFGTSPKPPGYHPAIKCTATSNMIEKHIEKPCQQLEKVWDFELSEILWLLYPPIIKHGLLEKHDLQYS